MTSTFKHGYALLVGVGHSEYRAYSLPAATLDAQSLKSILSDPARCGYPEQQIRLLHDEGATRGAILAGLEWLAIQANDDPEATVIVFFSGHGWRAPDDTYYLLPYDVVPTDLAGSTLSGQDFTAALRRIRARRLLVILDCCHAGGMASAKDAALTRGIPSGIVPEAPPSRLISELARGDGRAVFSSSRGLQKSWVRPDGKSSIYTHCLIQALQGAGNKQGDTVVNLSNLMDYLEKAVPTSAHDLQQEQTPFFEMASGNFPVALLMGGAGLQAQPPAPAREHAPVTTVTQHGNVVHGIQAGIINGSVTQNNGSR